MAARNPDGAYVTYWLVAEPHPSSHLSTHLIATLARYTLDV